MTSTDIVNLLKLLWALPRVAMRPAVGWLLDILRDLGSVSAGLLTLALLAIPAGLAFLLQRQLNAALDSPGRRLGLAAWLKLELWSSVLAVPVWPLRLLVATVRGLFRFSRRLIRRRPAAVEPSQPAGVQVQPQPEPLLVASLGPSFLLAGLVTAALYLMALAANPFLRAQLGLSRGLSAWQFLLLGRRPELAWYLPLERYPFLAGFLSAIFWAVLWSLAGIAVRVIFLRQIGGNLAADRENPEVLPLWRRRFGTPFLAAPSRSYLEWAVWPVAATTPLLIWAWFSLGGDPYRVHPGETAVAILLWISWALHLALRGRERLPVAVATQGPAPETQANGWPEVLAHLAAERQVTAPLPWDERTVEPLLFSEVDPRTAGFLSPLVAELLPAPRKLTPMQRSVLTKLALQGFVHVDPPLALEHLTLKEDLQEVIEDRSGQRVRHQIVLAQEGQGKTTLAMLAAANHALVHTRSTLIVVRSDDGANALAERFRQTILPSPLRWNVRVRHPGADLMNDLSQGIVPDVVICCLRDLVLTILDRTDTFAPFLRNIGLIVVDDVESFVGPVEVHAQLAFRRLVLRLAELLGLGDFGDQKEESAPQFLILGCDSMQETGKWAKSLCSVDAVARDFSRSAREARERETAEMAAVGIATAPGLSDESQPLQSFYRFRDFRAGAQERLGLEDLVAACERLAVPWHYRLCGDGRRDLGRGPLLLREEPLHYADSPEDACVLLLEGAWSEVRRECQRLVRAGARFSRFRAAGGEAARHTGDRAESIAFVLQVDPDVEMALTHFDPGFSLAPALDALPRPVIRPPTGLAVEPHLTADLVQHWTEVEEVVRVFGASTVPTLSWLAREGLLLCEPRIDVNDRANDYIEKVYVRALARAVCAPEEEEGAPGVRGLLPPKVAQVEVTAQNLIAIRDRTNLTELGVSDDASAHFFHYPGRIFKDSRGAYVVVSRAAEESGDDSKSTSRARRGDVLVEPLLTDEISSPRRQFQVRSLRNAEGTSQLLQAAGGSFPEPHRVLLGRYPFRLSLEPIEVKVEQIATYRLGPAHCDVRQRTLVDPETRERTRDLPLATVALLLIPNPEAESEPSAGMGPRLTLEGARLLAAALRALLPVLYRGAGESLQVALVVSDAGRRRPKDILLPDESLCLFDAEPGGNGTARAIYRDGLELPLRLCRLMVERTLSHVRLRALYDEWGEEAEIEAESRSEKTAAAEALDEGVRHEVLAWLDSRLQPEGGPLDWHGLAVTQSGSETGEGDLFDLGRCWYSRDGALSDLVWVRHRWPLPAHGEAMLDIGFDRATGAEARSPAPVPSALEQMETDRPDDRDRYAPRDVWFLPLGETAPKSSREALTEEPERLRRLHLQATVATAQATAPLIPLASLLRERSGAADVSDFQVRLDLVRYLTAFVQAIPAFAGGEPGTFFRAPVDTLLGRLGDERSKSLLLALLLRSCGIEAGVFLDPAGNAALVAAGLPEPAGDSGDQDLRQLEAWAAAASLPRLPGLWAVQPSTANNSVHCLLVPVSVTTGEVGTVHIERPENWVFLPLSLSISGGPQS
ncbi:MAG TPA: hypothetical protein VLB76_19415 [Thermoanaerobaculia bacterium]|jgi:hypothetical protein|nr:hypothetical protein [Thermoanaerobaculia bacterium]